MKKEEKKENDQRERIKKRKTEDSRSKSQAK